MSSNDQPQTEFGRGSAAAQHMSDKEILYAAAASQARLARKHAQFQLLREELEEIVGYLEALIAEMQAREAEGRWLIR